MKIIGGLPYGALEPPRLGTTPDGWDELTERVLALNQNQYAQGDLRAGLGLNGTFVLQTKQCVGFIGCAPIMELRSKGVHASKGYIIEGSGFAERLTGTSAGIPGAPDSAVHPVAVAASRVGVVVKYLTSSKPSCAVVGTRLDPPEDFGIPTDPFYTIADPLYNVPYGWVLDKRIPKQLPGSSWYEVVDDYGYYWLKNFNGA